MHISEQLQLEVVVKDPAFERILVPLDGSRSAERVLETVRVLCQRDGARAVLVRILEPQVFERGPASALDSVQIARLYLRQIAAALEEQGIEVETVVQTGSSPESVLAVAIEEDVSLIAMSTHGRMTPETVPFGKVAEQLLASSVLPILAIPSGMRVDVPRHSFRTILIPTDGSRSSDRIFPVALEFALSFGVDLAVLLQVVPPAATGRAEAERHVKAEDHLGRLARLFELNRIPTARFVIEEDDPVSAILRVAQEQKADVIAIASPERSALAVGALTEGVLRGSSAPVLLAP